MQASDIPVKFVIPFANAAGVGYITEPVPLSTSSPGRASLQTGFPPATFEPVASGGNPPWGADMNGLMFQATAWIRWASAGGVPVTYDSAFSTSIGGYPKGAFLQSATTGKFWISTVDNNPSDPDTGGANWIAFPDVLIQIQAGNYAVDTGAVNAYAVTLSPVPSSLASIVGSPMRVLANHANTIAAPTININGLGGVTMINSSGAPLSVGQISRAGQIFEGYLDGTYFQVTSPQPMATGGGGLLQPGMILMCPVETPFSGTLECNGSTQLIASFPNLFNVIGAKYGGDGVTTFKLPDLRGEFVRGWDHGRGLDPGPRTNRGDGTTGDHVGTNEASLVQLVSDAVTFDNPLYSGADLGPSPAFYQGGNDTTWSYNGPWWYSMVDGADPQGNKYGPAKAVTQISGTLSGGGAETRPVNISMMYVIVY